MKEKQHIDQLFQERFQGMETTPPPEVWNAIEAKLDGKKKDRKVIPIWWKLGGVAAILLLALLVGGQLFISPQTTTQPQLVEQENTNNKEIKKVKIPSEIKKKEIIQQHQITKDDAVQLKSNDDLKAKTISSSQKTQVATTKTKKGTPQKNTQTLNNIVSNQIEESKVAVHTNTKNNEDKNVSSVISQQQNNSETTAITTVDNNKINPPETTAKVNPLHSDKQEDAVASIDTEKNKEEDASNNLLEQNKPSILDAIKEQEDAVAETPSIKKRWQVMPTLAPVYYNSVSEGSSIDPTFADNSQSGDVNFSYGVQVSYAISNRLKVRTGIANVNVGYATSDLDLATGDVTASLQSINYGIERGVVVTAVDRGALQGTAQEGGPYANLTRKATEGDVVLTQNINYLEIPTELTYSLVNKKVSINVIGGFSTLVLGNNNISVASDDFQSELGEANNLNDISFSTNIGLGMNYNFSKRFSFNLEPIFKYQLNPYTDSAVSFQPYILGVYSGLSFRF